MLAMDVKCDVCGGQATVHMTVNDHGRAVEEHLCVGCCEKRYGMSFPDTPSPVQPNRRVGLKVRDNSLDWAEHEGVMPQWPVVCWMQGRQGFKKAWLRGTRRQCASCGREGEVVVGSDVSLAGQAETKLKTRYCLCYDCARAEGFAVSAVPDDELFVVVLQGRRGLNPGTGKSKQ